MSNWLDTTHACASLGIHASTLKRRRDSHGGFLENGTHWRFKTDSANSTMMWNVEAIQEEFNRRAVKARKGL